MSTPNRFIALLDETESRFQQRQKVREEKEQLLSQGGIFAANSEDAIKRRLSHLQTPPEVGVTITDRVRGLIPPAPGIPAELERLLGTNDLMGIHFLELGTWVSRAVVRVHVQSSQGHGYGTGFMVSPRLMLTNNHVLQNATEASQSRVEFNYENGLGGNMKTSIFARLAPEMLFLTDRDLDYTLVALNPESEPAAHGWLPLIEEQGKVMVGEWVNIIQHPNGEPKQLALRENLVVDELERFLHYRTDTAPGSSGSPVFNDQWEVVALHHSGVPERDAQGRILTVDNQLWAPWMGEHRIAWKANEGVRISRVIAHIKAQALDEQKRQLRAQMFETRPPVPEASVPLRQPEPQPQNETSTVGAQVNPDGSASWTFPVTVTVSVGTSAHQTLPAPPSTPAASVPPPLAPAQAEDRELTEALATLSTARTRTYYDAEADMDAAEQYYRSIQSGQSAQALFKQLSKLVYTTHEMALSYKPSMHVYPWVDLHPDLKLRSIYSGLPFDPEEFIREDFRIAQERAVRMRELMLHEASLGIERLEEEIDLLEASLPFNCEHVVPRSWFNKKNPMLGDLHHLFACEIGCNSFRSNIPYYDFPDFEEAVRDACGKRQGEEKFEPSHGKGAVARATLYFLLRYPGKVGDNNRELQQDRLMMLGTWHSDFPPDEYERHRNAAIFEKQGNRNPLIDHPEWVESIDFALGLGGTL